MSERETTRRMVEALRDLLANEPPMDAGGSPVVEHHEAQGRVYADWDRQVRAWRTLLAPRLIREALESEAAMPSQPDHVSGWSKP